MLLLRTPMMSLQASNRNLAKLFAGVQFIKNRIGMNKKVAFTVSIFFSTTILSLQSKVKYISDHLGDFDFGLFFREFNYQNQKKAESDFRKLIIDISDFKLRNSQAELIQFAENIIDEGFDGLFKSLEKKNFRGEITKEAIEANNCKASYLEFENNSRVRVDVASSLGKRKGRVIYENQQRLKVHRETETATEHEQNKTNQATEREENVINQNTEQEQSTKILNKNKI